MYVQGRHTISISLRTSYIISIPRHDSQSLFISTMTTLTTRQPPRILLAIFAFQNFKISLSVLHSSIFLVSTSGSVNMAWVGWVASHMIISVQASKQATRLRDLGFFLSIFFWVVSVFLLPFFTFWCGCGYSMRRWIPKKHTGFGLLYIPRKGKCSEQSELEARKRKVGCIWYACLAEVDWT